MPGKRENNVAPLGCEVGNELFFLPKMLIKKNFLLKKRAKKEGGNWILGGPSEQMPTAYKRDIGKGVGFGNKAKA